MDGQTIVLGLNRETAHRVIDVAPPGSVVNVKPPRRSPDQNALLWAALSDLSRAKPEGRVLPPEIWKCIFMASVGHQCRFEPSLDGKGVVPIGFKSSRLTKAEFSDLLEAVFAYGAEHNVTWSNPAERTAA